MKTKNKKIKSAIQLPSGLWFTAKRDYTESLFLPIDGKTAFGYYTFHRSKRHGTESIRLRKGNGEIFAAIISNGINANARSIAEFEGKLHVLYDLTVEGRELIGDHTAQDLIDIVSKASDSRK